MNNQIPSWDNDDSLSVSGNTPPLQNSTPEFGAEMNYQNYLWEDDLEFLNGDDLYVPENTPSPQTATAESPFEMNYQNYPGHNDIDFLGDNFNVSGNTPDWDTSLEVLEHNNLDVSQDTQDWDTNMELLEDNNLYVSGNALDWHSNLDVSEHTQNWDTNQEFLEDYNLNISGNTPNLENDVEFLEGENLFISEDTPPSQPPTEESLLCPILRSIIEGTYDTPVQPDNPIPRSETPQYSSPRSAFEMPSPSIGDLPTPQHIPAEQGGKLPGPLGPLAHEIYYINFIGTGSHRRRLRPGVVPRRKTAKIVAAADSEPYYNDGPRMEEFRETREILMTRLKNSRTVMSIRHKPMCSQLTRKPNETARKWTNRLSSRTAKMRRADLKHASKMNPSDAAFDSEYRRIFYETKAKRHRNNEAERARVLLIRRNYDLEHGRPRVQTPTPPDDSDDEKFYDHELDWPCPKPSGKDNALTMVSPMIIYEDSGANGSDSSPEASLAADSDAGNEDLDEDASFQQAQPAQAESDTGHGDLYLDALLQQAQVNSNAGDADLDLDTWFQQVPAELEAGYDDLCQDTSFQQTQANSNADCEDFSYDTWLQQVQANSDAEYEYENVFHDTGFEKLQANSEAECEDFSQDPWVQQAQANSDIGYKVWQDTCPANPEDGSCNPPKHKRQRVRKHQGDIESSSKRDTTPHACEECKRRKIRCDGQHWECLGYRQIIKEDKCTHCFKYGRICDQAKPR